MPQTFPTYDEIKKMSDDRIKGLVIDTKEKEELVQKVINERVLTRPNLKPIFTGDVPFVIKTKEEELKWQKILDERREAARPKIIDTELELKEKVEVLEAKKQTLERFCEFCDSKGVRHKKECTR